MASYLPEAGNLNGGNADMCSDVAGPSSSGSGDLFDFGSSSRFRSLTTMTTTKTCGMDSNFRITAPPTFVNQRHQIPFPRVYVSINERPLKFVPQS